MSTRNQDVDSLVVDLHLAIREIETFAKAKAAEISERKRRLEKIHDDLLARNEMGQLEMFERTGSIPPEVEEIISDPTRGW